MTLPESGRPNPDTEVDDRALARAVRPDQADDLAFGTEKVQFRTAWTPPKDLVRSSISSSAARSSRAPVVGLPAGRGLAGRAFPAVRRRAPVRVAAGPVASRRRGGASRREPAPLRPVGPGRSREDALGRNLSIRMIIRPMRTWRSAGPKSGRDAGEAGTG